MYCNLLSQACGEKASKGFGQTESPGAILDSRRLARRAKHREVIRQGEELFDAVDDKIVRYDFGRPQGGPKAEAQGCAEHFGLWRLHADALRPRLALGAAARWVWMRASSTLAGSSFGSWGTSSPLKALARMLWVRWSIRLLAEATLASS